MARHHSGDSEHTEPFCSPKPRQTFPDNRLLWSTDRHFPTHTANTRCSGDLQPIYCQFQRITKAEFFFQVLVQHVRIVSIHRTLHRQAAVQSQNEKIRVQAANFFVRCFALVSQQVVKDVQKQRLRFRGPYRVTQV